MAKKVGKQSAAKELVKEVKQAKPGVVPEVKKETRGRKSKYYVVIDHPVNNELLHSAHYVIRIGATWTGGNVEISVDNGDWQVCRHSVGYWWYDWSGIARGKHTVQARLNNDKGLVVKKSDVISITF
jgi:hypothetical protein